jgi:hypothetical protein
LCAISVRSAKLFLYSHFLARQPFRILALRLHYSPHRTASKTGWVMKVRNLIRMQLVLVAGFAAALLMASSSAAQEITNTEWPDRPGATEPLQAAPAQGATTANQPVAQAGVSNAATTPSMTIAEEAALAQPTTNSSAVTFWLIGAVAVALYVFAAGKRFSPHFAARTSPDERSISLS